MRYLMAALCVVLTACVGTPDGIEPIQGFDLKRYLGKWYEVARFDHSFERGLQRVTADYSLRRDGGINVINRGFDTASNNWEEAQGKAYFVGGNDIGHLKVSFFGPFYSSYIIFDLGENYEYSLVTSSNRSYFWLLSRTPEIDDRLKNDLINKVAGLGFQTQNLIFVSHVNEKHAVKKRGG